MKLTYQNLLTAAQSGDANERKRAYEAFQAWVSAAPRLSFSNRLTMMERHILEQIFRAKGFQKFQQQASK